MSTRLVTIIIITSSFFTGWIVGILMGKQSERTLQNQKKYFLQQEMNKIG